MICSNWGGYARLEFKPLEMLWRAFIIITLVILVAYALRNVPLISDIGKDSLYLCGNEYIVKTIVPVCFGVFGIDFNYDNSFIVFICILLFIAAAFFILAPFEKLLINKIVKGKHEHA